MEEVIRNDHNIIIENRKKFILTGVRDVSSFDEQTVMLDTVLGKLVIKGEQLHISLFDTEKGELSGEGHIHAMVYTKNEEPSGFFARLFR